MSKKKSSHNIEQELNMNNQQIVSQEQILSRSYSQEYRSKPTQPYIYPFVDQINESLYRSRISQQIIAQQKLKKQSSNRLILLNQELSQKLIKNLLKRCEIEQLSEPIKIQKSAQSAGDQRTKSLSLTDGIWVNKKFMTFQHFFNQALVDNRFQLLLIFTYEFVMTTVKLFAKITYSLFSNHDKIDHQKRLLKLLHCWVSYRHFEFEEYIE